MPLEDFMLDGLRAGRGGGEKKKEKMATGAERMYAACYLNPFLPVSSKQHSWVLLDGSLDGTKRVLRALCGLWKCTHSHTLTLNAFSSFLVSAKASERGLALQPEPETWTQWVSILIFRFCTLSYK